MKRPSLHRESQTKLAKTLAGEIQAQIGALPALKTSHVRALRREFSKRLTKADPALVLQLALNLLKLPQFEFRFIAYELVQHHRPTLASLDAPALERLGQGMDSWAAVDCFASYLAGPAWRERQISDSVVRRWAGSPDRWWRRAAVVSTVPLNNKARGGNGDPARTLEICRLLIDDRDDMVVKAMSWALRELAKRDEGLVREFLREEGGKLASRARREVENKLATGLKNPRKQSKTLV
jgi:3-methyladenine DNA glycosylase AlkD